MAAISQPMIAWDTADSIWRAAKALHEDNQPEIQISNLLHARRNLEGVVEWARKAGTSSYRSNKRIRLQLINASGAIQMCVDQLTTLISRVQQDRSDVDAIMKLMLLRTVIKTVQFAPPLDEVKESDSSPDQKSLELLRELGSVNVEVPEVASSIFNRPAPTTDPLSDEE